MRESTIFTAFIAILNITLNLKYSMKVEEIQELFRSFEAIAKEYEGAEYWSARELSTLLGYAKWEKFSNVINKAKDACLNAGENGYAWFKCAREVDDYIY